ncbi:MAG: hypothetical protein OCC45_12925 [Desulfotalea sp.]
MYSIIGIINAEQMTKISLLSLKKCAMASREDKKVGKSRKNVFDLLIGFCI